MRRLFMTLMLLLVAVPVWADEGASNVTMQTQGKTARDGNRLLDNLTPYSKGTGLEYVYGVMDSGSMGPVAGRRFCVPDEVTMLQLGDVVRGWLEKHPEARHLLAASLVATALAEAFPCSPK